MADRRMMRSPLEEQIGPDEIEAPTGDMMDDPLAEPQMIDGALMYQDENGNTVVDYDGAGPALADSRPLIDDEFYENLAERADLFTEQDLRKIAADLTERIEEDEKSREPWKKRLVRGIRLMGVVDDQGAGPFKGASRVVHPMLIEAGP